MDFDARQPSQKHKGNEVFSRRPAKSSQKHKGIKAFPNAFEKTRSAQIRSYYSLILNTKKGDLKDHPFYLRGSEVDPLKII